MSGDIFDRLEKARGVNVEEAFVFGVNLFTMIGLPTVH
jgi:hypothetical protein